MSIQRRIHINPQSKGSLGKSFEAEFRAAWLDWLSIPWAGSDLDDRHRSFAARHTSNVHPYCLGSDSDSKSTLLGLFRQITKSEEPIHIIDVRAQADGLILNALEELQIFELLAAEGIRFTFLLFPSEDTESMNNLVDLFSFAGDRVDYVLVHNPARIRSDLYSGSELEREFRNFGACQITLPTITPITLLAIKRAEAKAGRALSFSELGHPESGHLERLFAGEFQWAMQSLFPQYHGIASHLLPDRFLPLPALPPAARIVTPRDQAQPMLNLGS